MNNVEGIIKNNAVKLKHSRREIEIAPDITGDKRNKWIKKYRDKVDASVGEKLIFLSDTGTGSIAATGKGIFFDNFLQGGLQYIDFVEICSANPIEGGIFKPDKLLLDTKSGKTYELDGAIDGMDIVLLSEIINKIIELSKVGEAEFFCSRQDVALYEVSDDLKLIYLEILCNYAYISDEMIDADEYAAIGNFIVRMELGDDARNMLRKYMNSISDRLKTGTLLKRGREMTAYETGQWDAFRYSLLQDVIYLHEIRNSDDTWKNDGFIGSLLNHSGVRPAQADTMVKAVRLNKKMQQKGCDYTAIKKDWIKLFKETRYSEGYVPSMYLFCSGSVYGVDCYNDFFAPDDNSQKGINKKREIILQEIIMNNQKTLNVLINDMNCIASRLEQAVDESEEYKAKYKTLIERLKKACSGLDKTGLVQ